MNRSGEPGRNSACPCGSGKRYKNCHGQLAALPGVDGPGEPEARPVARVPRLEEGLARSLAVDRQLLVLGLELQSRHESAQARTEYERVLALDAHHPDALHLLALLDLEDGRPESALDKVQRAIASYPRHAPYHVSRARILLALGRFQDAAAAAETARGDEVECPESWAVSGARLVRAADLAALQGQPAATAPAASWAEAPTEPGGTANSISADRSQALKRYLDRAAELREQGLLADAEGLLRQALRLQPQEPYSLVALGRLLRDTFRLDEAAEIYRRAIALDPGDRASAVAELAGVLVERGEADQAKSMCSDALARRPRSLRLALPAKLSLKPVYADKGELAAVRTSYAQGLAQLCEMSRQFLGPNSEDTWESLVWSNFYLAYHGQNDVQLQTRYADFVGELLDRALPELRRPLPWPTIGKRRIRIGFASHYFYECTAGAYFRNWVTTLDRSRFETFVYHFRPGMDAVGRRLMEHADHFRRFAAERSVGASIRSDELDILVYPELGGNGLTFLLAALRLAPVQCAGWGHPVTTGHATIDYFFSSDLMEPEDAQSHYRERLVRLPGIGTDYTPPALAPEGGAIQAREALGLPRRGSIYLFPQSIYKIHPDNDSLIARVLAADPKGTLILFPGHTLQTTEQFLRRFAGALAAHGLDIRARVRMLPIMSRETYIRVNAACDVMLDSLHWSGGNTSLDALACALPVVTLPGRFMRGRQTLGMLQALGEPRLVARDEDDYVRIALRVAQDPQWRAELAESIRSGNDRLFRDRSAIDAMQDFYTSLFEG